jgi:hypothetical protein
MPSLAQRTSANCDAIVVEEGSLIERLKDLDSYKSIGPDNVHGLVLKNCAKVLVVSLTLIFNMSLNTGIVSDDWKMANVKP